MKKYIYLTLKNKKAKRHNRRLEIYPSNRKTQMLYNYEFINNPVYHQPNTNIVSYKTYAQISAPAQRYNDLQSLNESYI